MSYIIPDKNFTNSSESNVIAIFRIIKSHNARIFRQKHAVNTPIHVRVQMLGISISVYIVKSLIKIQSLLRCLLSIELSTALFLH